MKRLMSLIDGAAHAFWIRHDRDASPRRVLIVDDDERVRAFLETVLSAAGYETATSSDGPEALATFQTRGPFDVLVTDVMMPQMRGSELARRIRRLESSVKVLYVTGYADALFEEKSRLWADEAFLDKPCTPDALLEAVSLLISGHDAPSKAVWSSGA
jgi:two-component system, cell cycle sensor histidine kinase and response regulator CckA